MRNTRMMFFLTTVLGVLLLGVAYAAVQNITLTINGTATATPDQGNFDVRFTNYYIEDGYAGTVNVEITSNTKATINVTNLKNVGDSVACEFEIMNYSPDLAAEVSSTITTRGDTQYISVSKTMFNSITGDYYEPIYIAANQSEVGTLRLYISLNKLPVDTATVEFEIELIASPANS